MGQKRWNVKEIELYLDDHYLEMQAEDPEQPPKVLSFFRDKASQSGFPMAF